MEASDKIQSALDGLIRSIKLDAVYLFGSRAEGRATKDSDFDLAVLCPPKEVPSTEERLAAVVELEAILGGKVDLVILNEAGPIIGMQVVSKGKLIYEGDRRRRIDFTTYLYSSYAEFKELRAPMEANILKRKFYGG